MTQETSIAGMGQNVRRTILRLSWPAILEQFLICMASLVDTAMVGSIGAQATASVAINISTVWLINGFITALSVGFSFLTAHSVGEGDGKKVEATVRQAITASLILGAFLTVGAQLVCRPLPYLLGAAPDVAPNAQKYLQIVGMALIPQCLSVVLSAVLRSAGNTRLPLAANLASNLLNVVGNFLLIYPSRQIAVGGLTIPVWGMGLGVAGAAISTAVSQLILAGILLYLFLRVESPVRITPRGDYGLKRWLFGDLFRISIPVLLERTTLCLGQIALTAVISSLGTIPLAAHYLTNQTEGMLYLPAYGFSYTATTLVGQSMGAKMPKLADQFAKSISLISTAVIVAACVPVFFLSGPIIGLFTNDAAVVALGDGTLKIAAATELFFSYFLVVSGICRGAGDVKFPLLVSLIGMWGFRLGLVFVMTRLLHWGVNGVWIAIGIDSFIRAVLCLWRLYSGRWQHAWKG